MEPGELALSDREFERIKQRVYRVAGISLSDAKRTLVVSRLLKLVKALNLPSFDAYVDFLERSSTDKDAQDFVNALTTNLTRFYREDHHFEHLQHHVEALMQDRSRTAVGGKPREGVNLTDLASQHRGSALRAAAADSLRCVRP